MALEYWEYFLSIESDLEKCARYVDFSPSNYMAYSVEFARIIMAAVAEIDTVAKELCRLINSQSSAGNILQYAGVILNKYPNIVNVEMAIYRYDITVKPWESWSQSMSPLWWQGYNKIKHDRTAHFDMASLKNAISSVSGLLLILLYYYFEKNDEKKEEISSFYSPRVFDVVDSRPNSGITGGGIFWDYHLL